MFWLVLTVLLSIGAAACAIGVAFASVGEDKVLWGAGLAACVLIWGGFTVFLGLHNLGTGKVALLYSFSGKLTGTRENAGTFYTAPWNHVVQENVQTQSEAFELGQGNSAVSKDQQPIFAKLVINYQVDPKHVFDLYKNVGPNWKAKLVESRVLQDFKEVTATYPTIQITANREQLRVDTRERLKRELGPYSITVTDLFVPNIGFSDAYTSAIEAKQVQVQAAARAQAKVAQVQAEASQQVAQAEGDKLSTIARARGTAEANRLISGSITDRLIAMERAKALSKANTIYVPANWTAFGNLASK